MQERSASAGRGAGTNSNTSGIPGGAAAANRNNNSMLDKFKFFKDKDKSKTGAAKGSGAAKGAATKGKDKRLSDGATSGSASRPSSRQEAGAAGGAEPPPTPSKEKEKKSKLSLGGKSKKQETVPNGAISASQESQPTAKTKGIPNSKSMSGALLKKANGSMSAKNSLLQPSSSVQSKLDKSAAGQNIKREASPSVAQPAKTKIATIGKGTGSMLSKMPKGPGTASSAGSNSSLGGSSTTSSGIPMAGGIPKPGARSTSKGKDEGKSRSVSRDKSRDQLAKAAGNDQSRPMSPLGKQVQQGHQETGQSQQEPRSHGQRSSSSSQLSHAQAVAQHHAAQQREQQMQLQQQQQQEHIQQQKLQQQQQLQKQQEQQLIMQQQQQQVQQQRVSHASMIAMGKSAKTTHPSKMSQNLAAQQQNSPSQQQLQQQSSTHGATGHNTNTQAAMTSQQVNNQSGTSSKISTPSGDAPKGLRKPTKVDSDTQTNVSAINKVLAPSRDALTRGINERPTTSSNRQSVRKEQSSGSITSTDSTNQSSGGESGSGGTSQSNGNSHSSNDSVIYKPKEGERDSNKTVVTRPPVQDHISSLRRNRDGANKENRSSGSQSPHGKKVETTFEGKHVKTEQKEARKSQESKSPRETTFAEKDEEDDKLIQNIKPMQPILRAAPYAYLNVGKNNVLPRPSFHISTTLANSPLAHSQSASSRLGVNRPLIDPNKYSLSHLNLKRSALGGSRSTHDDDCASDADSADLAAGYMSDGDVLRSNHLDDINR